MRVFSVQQPWAWLIVNGYKPVENRSWATKIRERIAIHAGKKFDEEGFDWVCRTFPYIELLEALPFDQGGIVGTVLLTGCVKHYESPWFFGPFGFLLADPVPTDFLPMRGQLGFFEIDAEKLVSRRTPESTLRRRGDGK